MSEKRFCKNPIITSIYTADPAPMVYGDTLYLYTTHDEDVLEKPERYPGVSSEYLSENGLIPAAWDEENIYVYASNPYNIVPNAYFCLRQLKKPYRSLRKNMIKHISIGMPQQTQFMFKLDTSQPQFTVRHQLVHIKTKSYPYLHRT